MKRAIYIGKGVSDDIGNFINFGMTGWMSSGEFFVFVPDGSNEDCWWPVSEKDVYLTK
jgi:hypothetical protein